jgi:hypothetical protein
MNELQPPLLPLLKYVSINSPVLESKKASQCKVPHPVIRVLFLPTHFSFVLMTCPLFNSTESLFSVVVKIPILAHPSLKIVTPFSPASQAY